MKVININYYILLKIAKKT